ncbi:MAG: glycosyl transferase [Nitrospinaceae bacterium]|nr:MAG: glycosyl transferase [Nitrospinaceae bacterium]
MDYIPFLEKEGIHCTVVNYSSPVLYRWLYLKGWANSFWNRKNHSIYLDRLYSLVKMFYILLIARRFDIVYIEKVTPPAWWVNLLKRVNDQIIFDFDDAVFIQSPKRSDHIIKHSHKVVAGSHFNLDYSLSINRDTILLPTPVPIHLYPKSTKLPDRQKTGINIGWVGTTGNIKYLSLLEEPFARLAKSFPGLLQFTIIGHIKQFEQLKLQYPSIKLQLKPYIDPQFIFEHLSEFDIGVMPLFDGDWERGKCASKALFYMAAHVPVVCSGVGENNHVIQDGVNGYLANTEDEWVSKLTSLIENQELRIRLRAAGRKTVEKKYSTEVCYKTLRQKVLLKT